MNEKKTEFASICVCSVHLLKVKRVEWEKERSIHEDGVKRDKDNSVKSIWTHNLMFNCEEYAL